MPYFNCMVFACDYPLFVVLKSPGWYIYHGNGWKAVINALYFLSYFYAALGESLPAGQLSSTCCLESLPAGQLSSTCCLESHPAGQLSSTCCLESLPAGQLSSTCCLESLPAGQLSSTCCLEHGVKSLKEKLTDDVQFKNIALATGNKPHHARVNKI